MEKNRFLTFIYSFIPGAGYMYLNMMQAGVVAMVLFFGLSGLALAAQMEVLLFALPIIWFYTFFDTFHAAKMNLEERQERQEKMLETLNGFLGGDFAAFLKGKQRAVGICTMFLGAYVLFSGIVIPFIDNILYEFGLSMGPFQILMYRIPTLLIGLLLLYGGKKLLNQEEKKTEDEELVEYELEEESESMEE